MPFVTGYGRRGVLIAIYTLLVVTEYLMCVKALMALRILVVGYSEWAWHPTHCTSRAEYDMDWGG